LEATSSVPMMKERSSGAAVTLTEAGKRSVMILTVPVIFPVVVFRITASVTGRDARASPGAARRGREFWRTTQRPSTAGRPV
jgi:hypothetical protein